MTFGNISTLPFNTCDARELKCINVNERYFSDENKEFFFSGTKHPREDNPNLYYWAEMTELHTQTFNI